MGHTTRNRAAELAELLLNLSRDELATEEGRAQLAGALRTTLELVEGRACADCAFRRPGVQRATRRLSELLADAADHAEFLAGLTSPPLRLAS